MKEVDYAKEMSDLTFGERLWKVRYCFDFGLERPDTLGITHVHKIAYAPKISTCLSSPLDRVHLVIEVHLPGAVYTLLRQ